MSLDSSWTNLRRDLQQQLESVQILKDLICSSYQQKIHKLDALSTTISMGCHKKLIEIEGNNLLLQMKMKDLVDKYETGMLQAVLSYFSILKDELVMNRKKLHIHLRNYDKEKYYIDILKDFKMFGLNLCLETNGAIKLHPVAASSQQFDRCVQAVKDNINYMTLLADNFVGLNVIGVFRLENSKLLQSFKVCLAEDEPGKVKGLFCTFPIDSIHAFCVNGLRSQQLFYGSTDSEDDRCLYRSPWLCGYQFDEQFDSEMNPNMESLRTISSQYVKAFKLLSAIKSKQGSASTLHKVSLEKSRQTFYMFNKSSYHSKTKEFFQRKSENGINNSTLSTDEKTEDHILFLVLCRVLIRRLCTIDTIFNESIAQAALAQGFDAVTCSATGEYYLLRPEYLLPEFVMLTQFEGEAKSEQMQTFPIAKNESSKVSSQSFDIPNALNISVVSKKREIINEASVFDSYLDMEHDNCATLLNKNILRSKEMIWKHQLNVLNSSLSDYENDDENRRNLINKRNLILTIQNHINHFASEKRKLIFTTIK